MILNKKQIFCLGTLGWMSHINPYQTQKPPSANSYIYLPDEIASESKKRVSMMKSWMKCGWLDNSLWRVNNVKHLIHLKPNRAEGNVQFNYFSSKEKNVIRKHWTSELESESEIVTIMYPHPAWLFKKRTVFFPIFHFLKSVQSRQIQNIYIH